LRLAVYCDFPYRQHEGRVYAGQAFLIFLLGLSELVEHLALVGRLDPLDAPWHFPVSEGTEFHPLPHYERMSDPLRVFGVLGRSVRSFWRALDDVDTVWLFGPHPLAILFALLAMARGRRVALGVRQDYIPYVRNRHPGRRGLLAGAQLIDRAFRALARCSAVVAVGPTVAEQYTTARRLLAINVVLVGASELLGEDDPPAASTAEELVVLSVGRLDDEKNPLLLADVLAELQRDGRRWSMVVCGEGPLEGRLRERVHSYGLDDRVELRGFVAAGPALRALYRGSDFLLHVSFTEGVPQVLFEAFAAGLPVVATDVGSVAAVAGDAALLVAPDDAQAAAVALRRLADDRELRARLLDRGLKIAREHTREEQCRRVAEFLSAGSSCRRLPPTPT
jgi:glycosyltransferase involved in cell wall biosynthesis